MKRVCAAGLAACLLLFPHAAAVSGPPSVSAASAILVDAESGRVLYEKDAHTRRLHCGGYGPSGDRLYGE